MVSKQGADTIVNYVTNDFGSGAGYALGSAISVTADVWKNGSDSTALDTLTTSSFAWWDGAVQSATAYDGDTGSGSNPVYNTTFTYGASGQLASVYVGDGRPRTIT